MKHFTAIAAAILVSSSFLCPTASADDPRSYKERAKLTKQLTSLEQLYKSAVSRHRLSVRVLNQRIAKTLGKVAGASVTWGPRTRPFSWFVPCEMAPPTLAGPLTAPKRLGYNISGPGASHLFMMIRRDDQRPTIDAQKAVAARAAEMARILGRIRIVKAKLAAL